MQTLHAIAPLQSLVKQWRKEDLRVGFVPTMGNLHAGHISLVDIAKQQADRVIVSIFVNPMQFNNQADLDNYPRTLQEDCQWLAECGVHVVFNPSVEVMYPVPFEEQTRVKVPRLSDIHCGASRPGHFVGVATVVSKLFNLVLPDVAIFGEKDWQQLMVIRHMVRDLCFPLEIIGAPTVREEGGLAISSRNGYLTQEERKTAPVLFATLCSMRDQINAGNINFTQLEKKAGQALNKAGFKTDYIKVCERETLRSATADDQELIILAAAFLGKARLIDNLPFSLSNKSTGH